MYKEGYRSIINVDFSSIVVEDMQMRYKNLDYEDTFECTQFGTQTYAAM